MNRRAFIKTVSLATAATLATPYLTGCPSQPVIAGLTSILGNAAATVADLQGNATLGQILRTDTAAAVTAVNAWKSGTPADEAVQALNILANDLNLIPAAGPYVAQIDLAIATVEAILALLPAPTAQLKVTYVHKRTLTLTGPVPDKADDFKKEWNQLATDPKSRIK